MAYSRMTRERRKPVWYKEITREGKKIQVPMFRETLAHKGNRIEPETILEWINTRSFPYAEPNDFLLLRDKCLVSLTYILCGRIGEVLRLEKKQFEETPQFLFVHKYMVEKNKKNPERDTWALPRGGRLAPFTEITIAYLNALPQNQTRLFPMTRVRAWQIIKKITGKWCHWFRAMGEAYYMRNVFKEPIKFAVALRLQRSDTLIEYVPFEWKDYEDKLTA